jgi:AAA15 family ATPase/GTPase
MIQEIKIKNFLSFRDEVVLNFEATKDTTFEDYQVYEVAPGVRLLRFALIYGANASGKSNLLIALEFIRNFWYQQQSDLDSQTRTIPFLLDTETPKQPSVFEIKFYVNEIKYWYILHLDNKRVFLEKLYYYKTVQPTLLFSRELEGNNSIIKFNPLSIKVSPAVVEEITLKCWPNVSFFAARNQVNCSLPFIDDAGLWMKNGFLPMIHPDTKMFDYAGEKMMNNPALKSYLLDFIHHADFNITNVITEHIHAPMPRYFINAILEDDRFSDEHKKKVLANPVIEEVKTTFEHTVQNERGIETYILPNTRQSQGTRRTFGIEAAIYETLTNERFLSIDEIESSLHPDLVEFVIEQFLKTKNRSQLLVTSHYDPLLNTIDDLFRKDSVWFTEKNNDGNSSLYSLVEFNGLNKIRSFQKSYRNGVFGALPNITN